MKPDSGGMLYGWDETAHVVSVSSHEKDGRQMLTAYVRKDGGITTATRGFEPFILVAVEPFLAHLQNAEIIELEGDLDYRWLARFPTMKAAAAAKRRLDRGFKGDFKRVSDEYLFINDAVQQGLLATGMTHFGGMNDDEVLRMQLDIETDTTEGFDFPNAGRDGDEIIIISFSDSRGREKVISRREMSEKEMIAAISRVISEWDPDVIEGHNIFRFDLAYIETRARRHGVKLDWGRDGSSVTSHKSRLHLAEKRFDYPKYTVEGRAFVDTYILVQFYDLVKREMESYGLKNIAKYLGVAPDGRTYVEGSEIRNVWRDDPERLIAYALDDVRETRDIAAMLGAPYFYQGQMLPFSYQDIFVRGNATKINGLMLRHYLSRMHSVPKPLSRVGEVVGGFTDVRMFGVIHDVVACDVASLYPSLMLSYDISPDTDALGCFLEMLGELRNRRLDAKKRLKAEIDPLMRRRLDNQQGTFKILINSFFGYLGTDGAYFGDNAAANRVTTSGQALLKQMISWLEREGCGIIEVDTDGVYFRPPREGMSDEEIESLIERLNDTMPEGISVEVDGRYHAMLSYKIKNYALLKSNGQIIIKGSGLKSRGLEAFQREFLRRSIRMILEDREEDIEGLYAELRRAIEELTISINDLAKTDRIQEPLDTYREKVAQSSRGRKAGYELAIASGRALKPGDYVRYYITGDKKKVAAWKNAKEVSEFDPENPDVNIPYYLAKLDDVYKRVKRFANPDKENEGGSEGRLFDA